MPYLDSDTFSSGSLIHSLNSYKIVIGPAIGNFIDVSQYGACLTYGDYASLFSIVKALLHDEHKYEKELASVIAGINEYHKLNSWDDFIKKILTISKRNHKQKSIGKQLLSFADSHPHQ